MSALMRVTVEPGWNLDHHSLVDEPPVFEDGVCTNLSEDLLQITRGRVMIDVGFYCDRYRVVEIHDRNWNNPVRQIEIADRQQALQVVESWMKDQ